MASTYTPLGVELQATGENAGTWGTKTNTNLQIIEQISFVIEGSRVHIPYWVHYFWKFRGRFFSYKFGVGFSRTSSGSVFFEHLSALRVHFFVQFRVRFFRTS